MGTRMLFLVRRLAASPNLHSSMTPAPLSALRSTSSHTSGRFALELIRTIIRKSSNTALRSDLKDSSQPSAAVGVEGDHLSLAKPLDFDMASKVDGQESQMVTFELEPGQVIRAEAGNLVFMEDGIEMDTNTGGGLGSMFRRVITGQNMFVTDYVNRGNSNSKVGLGTDVPSKIIRLSLADYGGSVICQRGAFLAGSHTVDIRTEFTKLMAGFFGGEGFVLQRLSGEGDAFVKASGPLIHRELRDGETLRVSSGSLVAFSPSVEYDVQTLPGFKNVVFGGEGMFITVLNGPGTVYLQGLPFDRMVDQIARRIPARGGGMPIPIGVGGGGGGDGNGESAAVESESVSEAGGVGTAADAEAPIMNAESGVHPEGEVTPESMDDNLFGNAAPKPEAAQAPGNEPVDSVEAAGGWSAKDHDFTVPPPETGASEEEIWTEDSFGSEGGGEGGLEEDMGDVIGDENSGIVGTLKKLYTLFGGGDN